MDLGQMLRQRDLAYVYRALNEMEGLQKMSAQKARQMTDKVNMDAIACRVDSAIKQACQNGAYFITVNHLPDNIQQILRDRGFQVERGEQEGQTTISWK